jgi:hypothetical protein
MAKVFMAFLHSLQATMKYLQYGHNRFFPHPFQTIIRIILLFDADVAGKMYLGSQRINQMFKQKK